MIELNYLDISSSLLSRSHRRSDGRFDWSCRQWVRVDLAYHNDVVTMVDVVVVVDVAAHSLRRKKWFVDGAAIIEIDTF